jgi:hypothetical protein
MVQIKKSTVLLGVLAVAALAAVWKFVMQPKETAAPTATPAPSAEKKAAPQVAAPAPVVPTQPVAAAKQASAMKSYPNPAGMDDVRFTLSVDGMGVITDAKTDILAVHDISKKRQEAFAAGLPAAVNGKKLTELTAIDKVGGSSLTTQAFNEALGDLKSQL